MVINYKRLNNNTYEDQYEIPGKDQLINCLQNTNIFSKFDNKSGFWQIKMDDDSIPWTVFSCPKDISNGIHVTWTKKCSFYLSM